MELVKKGGALFDKRVFAPTRAFTRRREKWIKLYSRPAGRELCEAFLTVCIKPRG